VVISFFFFKLNPPTPPATPATPATYSRINAHNHNYDYQMKTSPSGSKIVVIVYICIYCRDIFIINTADVIYDNHSCKSPWQHLKIYLKSSPSPRRISSLTSNHAVTPFVRYLSRHIHTNPSYWLLPPCLPPILYLCPQLTLSTFTARSIM